MEENINLDKIIDNSSTLDNSLHSHCLEEVPLNLEIERKYLDTYTYRKEDAKKLINLSNYEISSAEQSKNLVNKIKEQVITQSESTNEAKPANYAEELKYIKEAKENANKLINSKPDYAIEGYLRVSRSIDELFKNIKDDRMFDANMELREIYEQKKLIMSNLALAYTKTGNYKEAIELDLKIIDMDPNFDKSYARLVSSYVQVDNLNQAQVYAQQLRMFKYDTVAKYENILSAFDEAFKKQEERSFKKMYKKSKKVEEKIQKKEFEDNKSEDNNNKSHQQLVKPSKKTNWLGVAFSGLFFVGSSLSLMLLYKFKHKFTR